MSKVVEIISTHINEFSGKSKTTGNPFSLRLQEAYLYGANPYPDRFEILLDSDQSAYTKGFYYLDDESIGINRQGKIEVKPVLVPGATDPRTKKAV